MRQPGGVRHRPRGYIAPEQFAMSEISSRAEDHDAARLWHGAARTAFAQRVWFGLICCAIHCLDKLFDFDAIRQWEYQATSTISN